jgi:hypothetical protein
MLVLSSFTNTVSGEFLFCAAVLRRNGRSQTCLSPCTIYELLWGGVEHQMNSLSRSRKVW